MFPLRFGVALALSIPMLTTGQTTTQKLSNGVTLVVEENHSAPIVAIDVFVRAGSARETAEDAGAAHMLEHIAFRGTPNHPDTGLDKASEALGYVLQANTQRELTHYFATCLAQDWKEVFGLLADAVQNPAPSDAAFAKEKRVVAQELAARVDSPLDAAYDRAYSLAFGASGYGSPTGGTAQTIQALTKETTLAFHKRWYTTGNTTVVVCGDVSAAEAKAAADLWFGGMARSAGDPFPALPTPTVKATEETGPYSRAALAVTYPAPAVGRIADSAALDALVGMTNARLRQPSAWGGSVPAFAMRFNTLSQPGIVVAILFCDEAKLQEVGTKLDAEMRLLFEGAFAERDFLSARDAELGGELYNAETNSGRAYALGYWSSLGGATTDSDYRKALASVDGAAAKRVAREVFDPEKQSRLAWHAATRGRP